MALFSRLVETKAARPADVSNATAQALAPQGRAGSFNYTYSPPDNVEQVVNGHYQRCLWVFRCVDAIACAEGSLPIYVWESHDDKAQRVDGYDALERLLNGPDPVNNYEEYWQFRYRLSTLLLLSQVGVFVRIVRDRDTNEPVQLHILDSDAVWPVKDQTKYVTGYKVRYATSNGALQEKTLDPNDVLFIRARPHPIDQYKQVTPLQAAGLSADTDYLARVFNANWLRNDGRPSMLIGVGSDDGGSLNPDDADTIKNMFSGGAGKAGEVRVVEAGKINAAQISGSPQDAQYMNSLQGSKQDIMNAFGVSEPFIAWAQGRTWDNATTEIKVVWQNTMKWHCKAVASGFMPLVREIKPGEDGILAHDYLKNPVLREAWEAETDRALKLQSGQAATIDETRIAAGLEPFDVPCSRVIWTANGPIGKNDKDTQAALELVQEFRPPAPVAPGAAPGQLPPGQGGAPATSQDMQTLATNLRNVVNSRAAQQQGDGGQRALPPGQQQQGLAAAKARLSHSPERKAARAPRPLRRKSRRLDREDDDGIIDAELVDDVPGDTAAKELTHELVGALRSWSRQMLGTVDGRLQSVKTRKGTRHWEPTAAEVKAGYEPRPITAVYVLQEDRWANQLLTDIRMMVRAAASRAMADIRPTLDIDGPALVRASKQVTQATKRLSDEFEKGARKRLRAIQALIRRMDKAGADLADIKQAVAAQQDALDQWAQQIAPKVAEAAVNAARRYMTDQSTSTGSKWVTRHDDRVRTSHREADGQVAAKGQSFNVGGSKLMFPGDSRAPMKEWIGCRCYTVPTG